MFKRDDGLTTEENEPIELWKFFRRVFLLAYFINNFFNSLEKKQKLITREQKNYLISGIRYMFRVVFFPNTLSKTDKCLETNFVFLSLYHTFYSNMPEGGLKNYLDVFIPWLIQNNPDVKIGINKIFEKGTETTKQLQ